MIHRINCCIRASGMTKEEFYSKSGISSATFSYWNTGKYKPTPKKLKNAAEVLGVDYNYLLTGFKAGKTKLSPKVQQAVELVQALRNDELDIIIAISRFFIAKRKGKN